MTPVEYCTCTERAISSWGAVGSCNPRPRNRSPGYPPSREPSTPSSGPTAGRTEEIVSSNSISIPEPVLASIPEQIVMCLLYTQVCHIKAAATVTYFSQTNLLKSPPSSEVFLASQAATGYNREVH